MDAHLLVAMANEIAAFFAGEEPGTAAANVANHLRRYWEPRMRKQIIEHASKGGEGLTPVARAGVELIGR
ncbi:MAG TPA: formate dehydrogenase subunit delta [Steroidobacteraceae bacterium]|jgi:formate dehydrogenase subunit delta